jgi:hypothetical protein
LLGILAFDLQLQIQLLRRSNDSCPSLFIEQFQTYLVLEWQRSWKTCGATLMLGKIVRQS